MLSLMGFACHIVLPIGTSVPSKCSPCPPAPYASGNFISTNDEGVSTMQEEPFGDIQELSTLCNMQNSMSHGVSSTAHITI